MSKESVSGDHLLNTKAMYLHDRDVNVNVPAPNQRKFLVIGWSQDNIGEAIRISLVRKYPASEIQVFSHALMPAQGIMAHRELDDFDTVIFVNGQTHLDWIENQTYDQISSAVFNTLTATVHGVSQFVKATLDLPYRKNIVMVGSMAYNHVLNGSAPYCAAKAGLQHFANCMAWELAPKNYDVFCVHPSNVEGAPMSLQTIRELMRFRGLTETEAHEYWSAHLPRERWLQMDDIGSIVAELVSGRMSYMSGSPVELAGGQR